MIRKQTESKEMGFLSNWSSTHINTYYIVILFSSAKFDSRFL